MPTAAFSNWIETEKSPDRVMIPMKNTDDDRSILAYCNNYKLQPDSGITNYWLDMMFAFGMKVYAFMEVTDRTFTGNILYLISPDYGPHKPNPDEMRNTWAVIINLDTYESSEPDKVTYGECNYGAMGQLIPPLPIDTKTWIPTAIEDLPS